MPAVAAAASWMESLKMPMRQIQAEYTVSELAILGWRGTEVAYNMAKAREGHRRANDGARPMPAAADSSINPDLQALEERLGPVVHKMVDDHGQVDLRRLTGDEALRYMSAMGIHIGGRA